MMIRYIDQHKNHFGVEPICRTLSDFLEDGFITSRGYRAAKKRIPAARTLKGQLLVPELVKIYQQNYSVYGVRKMWYAMNRAGWDIGRDQTHRLMQIVGIAGAHRGRKPITTRAAKVIDVSPDLVQRDFTADAPNRLWSLRSFQTIYYIPRVLGKIVFHLILRMSGPSLVFAIRLLLLMCFHGRLWVGVFLRPCILWGCR